MSKGSRASVFRISCILEGWDMGETGLVFSFKVVVNFISNLLNVISADNSFSN